MRAWSMATVCVLLSSVFFSPPLSAFDLSWTDPFGETTYTLSGPDIVGVGETAVIIATAGDPFWPDGWVASSWSVTDNGLPLGSGFSLWLDSSGNWSATYNQTYDAAGAHEIKFRAKDLGQGSGGHGWQWFELLGTIQVLVPSSVEATTGELSTWGGVKSLYR